MSVWLRYLLCVAQETHAHWLNPTNHPHPSPYIMSSHWAVSTYCTWNDIRRAFIYFVSICWSSRQATWLLLCCLSEFYSMKHVTHTSFYHLACVHWSHWISWVYALFYLVSCTVSKHATRSFEQSLHETHNNIIKNGNYKPQEFMI